METQNAGVARPLSRESRIGVIGAGFGGIAMAVTLMRRGFRNVSLFEREATIGGVWRDNVYPGAACDVPSRLYSFSFAPKQDWSHDYGRQAEILDYLRQVAARHGVLERTTLSANLTRATWSDAGWTLEFSGRPPVQVDVLVFAVGQLSWPVIPEINGLDGFEGALFHSARWPSDFSADGKRIACVGTGASAIQYVPRLAERAAQLYVFQRSPTHILPKPDRPRRTRSGPLAGLAHRVERGLLRRTLDLRYGIMRPGSMMAKLAERRARRNLENGVADPALREKLWPDHPIGCKRILLSDDFYPAMARPNVSLVTDGVRAFGPRHVETGAGDRLDCDAVVFGTGFASTEFLKGVEVFGRFGLALSEVWANGAAAYRGVQAPGFPNMFILYGPNTNLGHNSIVYMLEEQSRYVRRCLQEAVRRRAGWVDAPSALLAEDQRWKDSALARTSWAADCGSWYKQADGKITNNWPGTAGAYRAQLRATSVRKLLYGAPA